MLIPGPGAPQLVTFRYVKPVAEASAFRRANVQSAGYCAPELVRDDLGPVTARANVYALGAILFEMLAGTPPVEGPSAEVRQRHGDGDVPSLKEVRPYLRDRAYSVIGHLLAHDPAKRADPAAAVALLEAYANDPLLANPIKPRKKPRRRRY